MTTDRGANVAQSGNSFANGAPCPWWARGWEFRLLLDSQVNRWTVEA